MSDAESTIKFAILDGYASATGQPDEARIESIFHSLFCRLDVRWAIEKYLEELTGERGE